MKTSHAPGSPTLPDELVRRLRRTFRLDWHGTHGARHWARVMHHGTHIARSTGGDLRVVRLFALLHDARRWNEGHDPDHGSRAATWVVALHREGLLGLDDTRADWLAEACARHSLGGRSVNPTIAACWDADRLDLGRVGVRPDPKRMCTPIAAAPERIQFAVDWAAEQTVWRVTRPGARESLTHASSAGPRDS